MGAARGQGGPGVAGADVVAYGAGDAAPARGIGARNRCCDGAGMFGPRVQEREWLCSWHACGVLLFCLLVIGVRFPNLTRVVMQ